MKLSAMMTVVGVGLLGSMATARGESPDTSPPPATRPPPIDVNSPPEATTPPTTPPTTIPDVDEPVSPAAPIQPGVMPPLATPSALPPPAPPVGVEGSMGTTPMWMSRVGTAMMLGGGYEDFTYGNIKSMTGAGGSWDARLVAGTRQFVGLEAAYVGSAHSIQTLGLASNTNLISNGAEGALRVNIPIVRGNGLIEPFGFIEVFNKSRTSFEFSAEATVPWLILNPAKGSVAKEGRLQISVDWQRAPKGLTKGFVKISRAGAEPVTVRVNLFNPDSPTRDSLKGFAESDGCISIEAPHYTKKHDVAKARWEQIDDLGLTDSSMSIFPVTAESATPPQDSPCLEYRMYLFNPGSFEVDAIISPSLNIAPNRGLRFGLIEASYFSIAVENQCKPVPRAVLPEILRNPCGAPQRRDIRMSDQQNFLR